MRTRGRAFLLTLTRPRRPSWRPVKARQSTQKVRPGGEWAEERPAMATAAPPLDLEYYIKDVRIEQARKDGLDERRFVILAIGLYTFGGSTLLLAVITLLLVLVKL